MNVSGFNKTQRKLLSGMHSAYCNGEEIMVWEYSSYFRLGSNENNTVVGCIGHVC